MPRITITSQSGITRSVDSSEKFTLMEAIRDNGFDEMLALCGGNCSCATCHIYVDDAFRGLLAPPSREEVDLLEDLEARMPNSRLSCQILITPELDGISAIIAPMPEGD